MFSESFSCSSIKLMKKNFDDSNSKGDGNFFRSVEVSSYLVSRRKAEIYSRNLLKNLKFFIFFFEIFVRKLFKINVDIFFKILIQIVLYKFSHVERLQFLFLTTAEGNLMESKARDSNFFPCPCYEILKFFLEILKIDLSI